MSVDTPHLALPFKFEAIGGRHRAQVVDQDADEEIGMACEAILRYTRGERVDLPDFGVPDQTLRAGGADLEEIRSTLAVWEPRATPSIYRDADLIRSLAELIPDRIVVDTRFSRG